MRKHYRVRRYDIHTDWCPDNCILSMTEGEVLRDYGNHVTREQLRALDPEDDGGFELPQDCTLRVTIERNAT